MLHVRSIRKSSDWCFVNPAMNLTVCLKSPCKHSDTVGVKLSGAKSIKTSKLFIRAQGVYQRVHLLADNLFYTEPYTLLDAALPTAVHILSLSSIHLSTLQRMVNQGNANEAAAYTESVFRSFCFRRIFPTKGYCLNCTHYCRN